MRATSSTRSEQTQLNPSRSFSYSGSSQKKSAGGGGLPAPCSAAKRAFWLIARNVARIMAVTLVSSFVLILSKLFITLMTAMAFYYVITTRLGDAMNGIFFPTFLTTGCAYFAASMFNEIFGTAIWTILQCFVADEEMFGSGEGHMFAPGSLKSCISDTQRKAMELAAEEAKKSGKTAPEPEESAAPAGGNTPDM